MSDAEQQAAALTAAVAVLDKEDVSAAEVQGVLKILGQEVPVEACENMIKYVNAEKATSGGIMAPEVMQTRDLAASGPGGIPKCSVGVTDEGLECNETMAYFLEESSKKFADLPYFGVRDGAEYKWATFAEVHTEVQSFGSGIQKLCNLNFGSHVGINLQTQKSWMIAHLANTMFGMVTVTLYDTLGEEAVEYIVDQAELTTIVANATSAQKLVSTAQAHPALKFIIVVGDVSDELRKAGEAAGVTVLAFAEVTSEGAKAPVTPEMPKPDDMLLICYTSGTTGMPKGVMHTQRSLASGAAKNPIGLGPGTVHLSFLPLAHIMELYIQACNLKFGVASGFFSGNVQKLLEDMAVLKPTMFVAVPRLLNKIHDKVKASMGQAEGVKKLVGHLAVESKKKSLAKGLYRSLWDFIVFDKIKAMFGGRVQVICTGSAPIAPAVLEFYRVYFGSVVLEGYGMSEACPTHFTQPTDFLGAGTVGAPAGVCQTKLVDVPEMKYFSTDKPFPRGEICFKGPHVTKGYYKLPDKTAEALDEDGWLHSGDIGQWKDNGTLQIFDRKKHIFKLSQGEYVAPEKCENIFGQNDFVAQSFTYGNSLKSELVAIIVPDPDVLLPWAKSQNIEGDFAALCANDDVKVMILKSIDTSSRAAGLKGFEVCKAIKLEASPFTPENGLLTPTSKLKRQTLKEHYMATIDALYESRSA